VDLELADRAYLITGGTDGLGLALARLLVAEGANVAVCGRDQARRAAAREALGERALVEAVDVTDADQLDAFVDRALGEFGRLDGVVNNAGHASAGPVERSSDDAWRADYELKVLAALRVARRATPALADRAGSILNVLSITARAPGANSTPTAASRAAGLALTKALAGELGPRGVRANAILIGLIESGQWVRTAERAGTDVAELYRSIAASQSIPLGRFGRAEEFAALAAFVLSPRAGYLSGVAINLDGGLSPVP
jgi:NAD(P)-dependent dehydrogenase (short-subunit alcohol dehydrogenase family)